MKISELSKAAGVPVATVKYYLREGLLPAGEPVTATSSSYDDAHVARVRLIRALVEGAGLSIAQVRRVAETLDDPPDTWHDMLGTVQGVLSGPPDEHLQTSSADTLLKHLGWTVGSRSPARADLARALARVNAGGIELSAQDLDGYAAAAHAAATIDVASLPTSSPEAALWHAIAGTALMDPVLVALRRLAQEHISSKTFTRKHTSRTPRTSETSRSSAAGRTPRT